MTITNEGGKKVTASIEPLKPCPFCGGPAHFVIQGGYHVICAQCSAKSRNLTDQARVADDWNRRAALAHDEQAEPKPVAYQQFKDGKWEQCSEFVAKGWGSKVDEGCRPLYAAPVPEQASVPDGWKMVPVDPTEAMCRAGESSAGASSKENWIDGFYTPENVEVIWRDMLAASPRSVS